MNCLKNSKQLWVFSLAMLLMMATCILAPRPATAIPCYYNGYVTFFDVYYTGDSWFAFRTKPIRKIQHFVFIDDGTMNTFPELQRAELVRSAAQNNTKLQFRVQYSGTTCPDLDADNVGYTFDSVDTMSAYPN